MRNYIKNVVVKCGNGAAQRLVNNYNNLYDDSVFTLDHAICKLLSKGYDARDIMNLTV